MLRDIRDMTKRYLRLIAQVVDENGNKVFNPTSDCVQTALRQDVENIESTHWDILLMHLGSVISFGLVHILFYCLFILKYLIFHQQASQETLCQKLV